MQQKSKTNNSGALLYPVTEKIDIIGTGLKPDRLIWVIFCPSQVGLIPVYKISGSDLDSALDQVH